MRLVCAIGLGMTLLMTASSLLAKDALPYKATIDGTDVYVRSGPGKNYYPTDKLQRGTMVEVYRHDPGGWYAIRPPQDSFSWVAGEHLRLADDSIAEVVTNKAVAFVGSRFRDVRDVRQVKLDRGEQVEIVGEKRFTEEGESVAQTWYKIMPPAGEFRWVYGKLVVKQREADRRVNQTAANQTADDESYEPTPIEAEPESALADFEPTSTDLRPEAAVDGDEEVAVASYEETTPAPLAAGEEPALLPQAGDEQPVRIIEDGDASIPASSSTAERVPPRSNDELGAALLRIVKAGEPDTWDFGELKVRTDAAMADASSALQRGRARRVLRQIAHFESVQDEFFEAEAIREETNRRNQEIEQAAAESVIPAAAEESVEEVPERPTVERFDGYGRLVSVRTTRRNAPPFALRNAEGDVIMFVTPAPGVQLSTYLTRTVGLTGMRDYLPKLKMPHLMVQRVELIEKAETE